METFLWWQGHVEHHMLESQQWIKLLEDVARKQAEGEEEAARRMSIAKWLTWLHEGLAAGLGRQHLMTRMSLGWVPTANATGNVGDVPGLGDDDGIDGLTSDQLTTIEESRQEGGAPANAQREADDEAAGWGKQWLVGEHYEQLGWPEIGEGGRKQLLLRELTAACNTFPLTTGLGWDVLLQ